MIIVPNGGDFSFENKTVTELVTVTHPILDSFQILNKTKHCRVTIGIVDGKMIVVIMNPDDEIFKLEEPSSAETHSI